MKQQVELDVPTPAPVQVDPARTLLVLVDMENEFCHPDGRLYLGPEAEEATRRSADAAARARHEGWRVVWIRSVREADAVEFTAFDRGPHLVQGTWAVDYSEPLQVAEGEMVIEKRSHDCFNRTGLEGWLAEQGIEGPDWHVLVAGVATNICVDLAVTGFSVRDYRVGLLLDCVAPRSGPDAAAVLARYGHRAYRYNVAVTSLDLVGSAAVDTHLVPR